LQAQQFAREGWIQVDRRTGVNDKGWVEGHV
jgi:hypothetical protein